jgi:hypothetical protein
MEEIQTPKGTEEVKPETITPDETDQQPQPKPEDTVDFWKQKFADSSREAQMLLEAQKQREKAEQELTKEPTDSEFRTAFPSWDLFDETQKELARRTYGAERNAANATRTAQELKDERAWNTSIELVTSSDPALQGKEQAFKQFASKPQYKNVPMDVLVAAFLQKQGPSTEPRPTPKPGLEPGSGGPRTPEKPKSLSAEQLATLRASDPRAYQDYLKTHTLELEV